MGLETKQSMNNTYVSSQFNLSSSSTTFIPIGKVLNCRPQLTPIFKYQRMVLILQEQVKNEVFEL